MHLFECYSIMRKMYALQVRLLLAGKGPLPPECRSHPGRSECKVDKLLRA